MPTMIIRRCRIRRSKRRIPRWNPFKSTETTTGNLLQTACNALELRSTSCRQDLSERHESLKESAAYIASGLGGRRCAPAGWGGSRFARIWDQILNPDIPGTVSRNPSCLYSNRSGFQALSIDIGFEVVWCRIREFVVTGQDLGYGLRDLVGNSWLISQESFGEDWNA